MIGHIGLEDLKLRCKVGVDEDERITFQDIFADVQVEVDMAQAIFGDHLTDTIDYTAIADAMADYVNGREFHLLEKMTFELIEMLFDLFPITWVWLKLKKPQAYAAAKCAYVEMERFLEEEQ
jgi:7,8-dihydroneopterin aldolase/epimerase/oxygenase